MLIPVGKRILIKPVEAKSGALILNTTKPTQFTVISIGDEVTKVKPGNTIYMEKHWGVEIDYENQKFLCIDEATVLAKFD